MADVYKKFGLEAGTCDFIGHAMALHLDDSYGDFNFNSSSSTC